MPSIKDVLVALEDDSVSFGYAEKDDLKTVKEVLWKLGYPADVDRKPFSRKATLYLSCAVGRMTKT